MVLTNLAWRYIPAELPVEPAARERLEQLCRKQSVSPMEASQILDALTVIANMAPRDHPIWKLRLEMTPWGLPLLHQEKEKLMHDMAAQTGPPPEEGLWFPPEDLEEEED